MSNSLHRSVDTFAAAAIAQAQSGDITGALEQISAFVAGIDLQDAAMARVFGAPQLDLACLAIGAATGIAPIQNIHPECAVYVVTALYRSGGHTRVLKDIIAADPATKAVILVTGLADGLTQTEIAAFFATLPQVAVECAPVSPYEARLRWLQGRLAALAPARTYLLQHQHDTVAIAACQPGLTGRLLYFHHGDHSLSLGIHVPHATHIDFNPKSFYHCREHEGVAGNEVWPLVVDDPQPTLPRAFRQSGTLTTATSGGFEKFEAPHLSNQIPYLYTYVGVLPLIMAASGGTHVHFGPLTPPLRQEIEAALAAAAIPLERFRQIDFVPSLATAFLEHGVDVYLTSFPKGGGRAMVDAMAAGLPGIVHSNYRSMFFCNIDDAYPGALVWRTPDELAALLARLDEATLQHHSAIARQTYETQHHPALLAAAIRRTVSGDPTPPPERLLYHPDALQDFLDEQQAANNAFAMRDRLAADLAATQAALATTTAAAERRERELLALYGSLSWRLTRPVRALNWVKRKLAGK